MEDQLGVRARLLAAGGAAFVAATIVNPLDVIKTRMQAQAAAASSTPAASLHHSTLYEPRSRQLFHQLSYNDIIKAVHHDPPQAPQRRFAVGCGSTVVLPTDELPWDYRRWGITEAPLCTKYAPGACSSSSSLRVGAAVQGAAGPGAAALPTSSLWDACRHIVRHEGVPVLWRGTATSLLIAVPMVGIYMPLYDHLLERYSPSLGGVAPVVAGMSARAFACFAVAPFELLRTRFQAMGGRNVTLRDTVATLTNSSHASSSSHTSSWASSGGSPSLGRRAHAAAADTLRLLRTVPQWWTGFGATLVRDVPFSALYWAMVEPLRSAMLPKQSHFPWPGLRHSTPTGAAAAAGSSSSSSSGADATGVDSSAAHAAGPAAPVRPGGGQRVHHSQQEILLANMVSGLVAGGLAAAATTPFDVVKTRHQIMSRAAGSERRSVLGTLRDVYAQEGWEGLFTGVKPRAYRAAPACAIVISVYELLKSWLSEQ